MTSKTSFTIADLKAAFPEYRVLHSDDPTPLRVAVMLPGAMLATINLTLGTLTTSVEAIWGSGKRIEFTQSDEIAAQKAIEKELLPVWKAAGFEPTGERGFDDDTPGVEPSYTVTLKKNVRSLDDVKAAFQWIANDAETHVQV